MNIYILIITLLNPILKEDKVVINKTYEIDNPAEMLVIIDNIYGDVIVEPSSNNKIHLSLEILISGHSDQLVEKAKAELKLGELLTNDSLMFYTKAPFVKRSDWRKGWGFHMKEDPKYAFKYQYKVKVPRNISVEARTVNNGNVYVQNLDGPVKACNVNGEVEIKNARKVLQASTVNGDVTISFLESPKEPIDFNTVNGDFHFELPKNFSAKVYFDSMNGDLYTSFDYRKTSPKVERSKKHGTFKIGTKTGVEIGNGGPELSFRSINGNVYLDKSK